MRQFWTYVREHPRGISGAIQTEVVFVLPKDYGWGMRRTQYVIEERIWGFWPEDENVQLIGQNMKKLISEHGLALEIIYDDPQFSFEDKYAQVFFWNDTIG